VRGRPKLPPEENPSYVCEQCGKLHQVNNKYKLKVRKYCSISCANSARAFVGPLLPKKRKQNRIMVEVLCAHCGEPKMIYKNNVKVRNFCNNTCMMAHKWGVKTKRVYVSNGLPVGRAAGYKVPLKEYNPCEGDYFHVQKLTNIEGEQWRKFWDSDQREYHISSMGRVKSVSLVNGSEMVIKQQFGTDCKDRSLWQCSVGGSKSKRFATHLMVAKYFVVNPYKYKLTEFIDGDSKNVKASNICWGRREAIGWTKEAQAEAFSDMTGTGKEDSEVAIGIARYIWTNEIVHLNTAWGVAMIQLRKVVRNHLCHLTSHTPTQETISDVIQESLIKAQQAIDTGKLRNPDNVEAWLARIARNTAVTYGKKNHHITVNRQENRNGEEFSLYDYESSSEFAYTPAWGR
jgi:hypothetical protein